MKKFVCPVCGYVYEGENPPEKCPQCGVPGSKFTEVKEDSLNYACEHVIGVGAKGKIDDEVYAGLKANFEGECTEVGMYIAMSRQAIREGYPEIGAFYLQAAYEEAEHAPHPANLSLPNVPKSLVTMPFTTLFTKWLRTKPATAEALRECSRDISANNCITFVCCRALRGSTRCLYVTFLRLFFRIIY